MPTVFLLALLLTDISSIANFISPAAHTCPAAKAALLFNNLDPTAVPTGLGLSDGG